MEERQILTQYEMIYAEELGKKIYKSMACETLRYSSKIFYLRLLILLCHKCGIMISSQFLERGNGGKQTV